jgi:glutathione S-transferase
MLTQSAAIGRYLAKKYGLIPDDSFDAARCDEIVNALDDLRKSNFHR